MHNLPSNGDNVADTDDYEQGGAQAKGWLQGAVVHLREERDYDVHVIAAHQHNYH